jgi:hypothetical protein
MPIIYHLTRADAPITDPIYGFHDLDEVHLKKEAYTAALPAGDYLVRHRVTGRVVLEFSIKYKWEND